MTTAISPAEEFAFQELATPPKERSEDINCVLVSSAELILSNVAQLRFVQVTLENPCLADELISVISGLRKGKDRPIDRDGTLIFPNILEDGIDSDLANRYLDKMEEVEDENDPDYNARDYLYLINAVGLSRHVMVEKSTQPSRLASEGILEALADTASETDKPMLVVLSDEPMAFVGAEEYTYGAPENLTNQANMEIVLNSKGAVTSFEAHPRVVDFIESSAETT